MKNHLTSTLLILLLIMALPIFILQVNAVSWSVETPLTTHPERDQTPALTQTADEKIWVFWHTFRGAGGSSEIYYRTYNGASWSGDTRFTANLCEDINPAVIQTKDGKMWVFWISDKTGPYGNYEIYYKTSSNNGASWSSIVQLTSWPHNTYLYVDGLDDNKTGNWTRNGSSPYLSTIDHPANYINQTTQSVMGSIGDFSFQNLTQYYRGKVFIEMNATQLVATGDSPDNVEVWLYDQVSLSYFLAGTLTPSNATWSWVTSADVSSTLNTMDKINSAKVYLVKKTSGTANNIKIDAMRIRVYNPDEDRRPSVMQALDGKIWVAWYSNRTGNPELFYKTYDGEFWSDDTQLTNNAVVDIEPSVVHASDGKIWVFWSTYRTDNYDIYYMTSSNNGASWSSETQLTTNNSWDELSSAMQARDGKIWVAWQADRSGPDQNIYYKIYDGATWSSDMDLVISGSEDQQPSIFQAANKTIWVAWATDRSDGMDIWYKVTLPNQHDVGVVSITPSPNYVNRDFGTQIIDIQVKARNYGLSSETFDVTLYYNSTIIGIQTVTGLAPNVIATFTFQWDTSKTPRGIYVVKATASIVPGDVDLTDNALNDGIVVVTIPGDVNGDIIVNILDIAELNVHWYDPPTVGLGGYDSNVDINKDGFINIFDKALINMHWHESN